MFVLWYAVCIFVFLCVRAYVSSWKTYRARSYLGSPRASLYSKTLAKDVLILETPNSEDGKVCSWQGKREKEIMSRLSVAGTLDLLGNTGEILK